MAKFTVCADVVVFAEDRSKVLLIKRRAASRAFPGAWAFPGGHVEEGELLADAASRELLEETGVNVPESRLKQFGVYDGFCRDPRGRALSVVFVSDLPAEVPAVGGDDAQAATWAYVDEPLTSELAFDHSQILEDVIRGTLGSSPPRRFK